MVFPKLDVGATEPVAGHVASEEFRRDVLPILRTHCGNCHGPDLQEARVRFDTLSTDLVGNRAAAQTWREALQLLHAGKMPPDEESALSVPDRETLTGWIQKQLDAAIAVQRSSGGRIVMRRLNRTQYQHTMRDLLGLDMDYARDLPPDGLSPDGYRNNGQSLSLSAIQLEYYLDSARRALERVIVTGPPPRVFRHRFEKSNVSGWRGPTERSNRLERAQKFLARIVDDYPESGRFRVRVRTRAELREAKGFPILEVAVGYRPDTEVYFAIAGRREIVSEGLQQLEFEGRIENFPLPVRGQGKYPGLVIRLRNVYDDGSPVPAKLQALTRQGKEVKAFLPEPNMPALLVESVEFEGPVYSQWPPGRHRKILFESPLRQSNELEYVRQVFERFMTRAFRRPVHRGEVEEVLAFFMRIRPHFIRFEAAVRESLAMVLIQPEFLYLMEPASEKRYANDYELATRLSYFLWGTMPDQRLFDQAGRGLLGNPAVLGAEVDRMLVDPRSRRFTRGFVTQWLGLDRTDHVSVSTDYYPDFQESLKSDMVGETTALFSQLLKDNADLCLMLNADFTMLNEPLARHYGIQGVYGEVFRQVSLPDPERRGGLLGHAGILLANSSGQDSHPIRRAVFIRDRLLGDPPPPPPPDVPELDEADPQFAKRSVREQLEIHRSTESCNACHRNIDPWGIALENFDAVGRWREQVRKKHGDQFEHRPVRSRDVLPDGTILDGPAGLRAHLLEEHRDAFVRGVVKNLLTYATGRTLELSDDETLDALSAACAEDAYRLRDLVHRIVSSDAFREK